MDEEATTDLLLKYAKQADDDDDEHEASINDFVLVDVENIKSNMDDIVRNVAFLNELKTATSATAETTMFVYRKRDHERFVLKRLTPDSFSKSFTRLEIAYQQANVLMTIGQHVNLVAIKQVFQENGHLYMLNEYVPGGNLANVIKEQNGVLLPEETIIGWFRQMVEGVRFLHGKYLAHGDIKPQNMLLSSNRKMLRLSDFGLGNIFTSVGGLSLLARPGYSVSQLYAAPETELLDDFQKVYDKIRDDQGDNAPVYTTDDPFSAFEKADVWSMGVVIYELAVLKRPFSGLRMIMTREPDPLPTNCGYELQETLTQMLKKYPWERISVGRLVMEPILNVKKILRHPASSKVKNSDTAQPVTYTAEEFEDLYAMISRAIENNDIETVQNGVRQAAAKSDLLLQRMLAYTLDHPLGDSLLHRATRRGLDKICRVLLDAGAAHDSVNKDGDQPLHVASSEGHVEAAKVLLSFSADVSAKGAAGRTALHMAAAVGHVPVANMLIADGGADVNATSSPEDYQLTPLHLAAFFGFVPMIELLVENGADCNNLPDRHGDLPIHSAARNGKPGAVEALIQKGAKMDATGYNGRSTFHHAIHGGFPDVVEALILRGADVNAKSQQDKQSRTPMHIAVGKQNLQIINLLIDHRALMTVPDVNGDTPLHMAAARGFASIVELFLDKARMSTETKNEKTGYTPLHSAAAAGQRNCVTLLIKRGAFVEAPSNLETCFRQTPLQVAATSGQIETARLLLQSGADMSAEDAKGNDTLALATINNHKQVIRLLVESFGARIDARSSLDGRAALHHAARLGNYEAAKALLERMAGLEVKDSKGRTPFNEAVLSGQKAIAELLWSWGAVTGYPDHDGNMPIHLAVINNHVDLIEFLVVRARANIEAINTSLKTPLQLACSLNLEIPAETLLRLGAEKHVRTGDGQAQTPLQIAAANGFVRICRLLLKAGAAVDQRNFLDETALMLAIQEGRTECAKILLVEGNASVELFDCDGKRPLHFAVLANSAEACQLLLADGRKQASMVVPNNKKESPFNLAARLGACDVGRVMLAKQRGLIDVVNADGQTALHIAAEHGQLEFVKLLVTSGSNKAKKDERGATPLDLANKSNSAQVAVFLQQTAA